MCLLFPLASMEYHDVLPKIYLSSMRFDAWNLACKKSTLGKIQKSSITQIKHVDCISLASFCQSRAVYWNHQWVKNIPSLCWERNIYCQLRVRRALSIFIDVLLRTRRGLSLYNVYGDSTLAFWFSVGTSLNSDSALLVLNWRYVHRWTSFFIGILWT